MDLVRQASLINFIIGTKKETPEGIVSLVAVCKINIHAESLRFLIDRKATVNGLPLAVVSMRLI